MKVRELRSRERHRVEKLRQYFITVQSGYEALLRTIISDTKLPELSPPYRNLRVRIDLPSLREQHFKRSGEATCAIYQTHTRVTCNITVLHTAVHEYTLKSAYHTVKKGCDSHEDPRCPENRNPLREVAVKLLPSTSCSMTLLDNRSPLTSNHLKSP